jgi:hypothetical protein
MSKAFNPIIKKFNLWGLQEFSKESKRLWLDYLKF